MIVRADEPKFWLKERELKAKEHLLNSYDEWLSFCRIALEIQASKLWKETAKTWHEYVKQTWDYDSSRVRQFKGSLPYAEKILEVTNNVVSLKESEIRKLKTVVSHENPNMPRVYQIGKKVASELGEKIEASHFRHSLNILEEAETTKGYVDVGTDVPVPIDFEDSTTLAVLNSIDEARKRNTQRILDKKRKVKVRAKKVDGMYQLIAENGEKLPDTINFVFWLGETDESKNY